MSNVLSIVLVINNSNHKLIHVSVISLSFGTLGRIFPLPLCNLLSRNRCIEVVFGVKVSSLFGQKFVHCLLVKEKFGEPTS